MHLVKKFFNTLFLSLFLFSLLSCTESIDSLTEDYNSVFKKSSSAPLPSEISESKVSKNYSIKDVSFNPDEMLGNNYTVQNYSTLCLIAPDDGESYEWTLEAVKGSGYSEKAEPFKLSKEQQLNLYVPKEGLTVWTEYTLTLTVTAGDGSIYSDTATVWIVPS